MCDKSYDLLTELQTYGAKHAFASKICAFFAPSSTVIGATVTSIPGSLGRTIVRMVFEVSLGSVVEVRKRTNTRTTTTTGCCVNVVIRKKGGGRKKKEVNLYPVVDLQIRPLEPKSEYGLLRQMK